MSNKTTNITVIIRCKNEERWVGHAIQSALDFLDKPEILVLDNNSKDESRHVVQNFVSFEDIRVIDVDSYTPGKVLNLAASQAKYPTLLILSAHCVLLKLDMGRVRAELKNHRAVFGKQIPTYHGKRITPRYLWANFGDTPQVNLVSEAEKRHFLHNGMAAYDREFLKAHPFDEKLSGKEDRYWANDLVKQGHSFYYAPHLMVANHHWTPDGNTWKGIG